MNDFVDNLKKLTYKQQNALVLILLGENNKSVASKIGVDENTIYRWRNDINFKSVLLDMRIQVLENMEVQLHNLGNKAIKKLTHLLDNAENENNQLKASTFILDKIMQYEQL